MSSRILALACFACASTPSLAVGDASVRYTTQLVASVPHAAPAIVTGTTTSTGSGNLQLFSDFSRDYDSGPITDLFGRPVANAKASTFAEVDLVNRKMRFSASADYVPSGIGGLSVGTVTAIGSIDYSDTLTAPADASPGFMHLALPVSSIVSFQAGAPAGQAAATLNITVDVSYVQGSHVDSGSASIFDRCTLGGCVTPTAVSFAQADGFTATVTPRSGVDGIDIIDLTIPTFGPGQVVNLHVGLTASAFTGAAIDGTHTALIQLTLPSGEQWTSASGLLAAPVPEPADWALLLAGGAVLVGRARRGRAVAG